MDFTDSGSAQNGAAGITTAVHGHVIDRSGISYNGDGDVRWINSDGFGENYEEDANSSSDRSSACEEDQDQIRIPFWDGDSASSAIYICDAAMRRVEDGGTPPTAELPSY